MLIKWPHLTHYKVSNCIWVLKSFFLSYFIFNNTFFPTIELSNGFNITLGLKIEDSYEKYIAKC